MLHASQRRPSRLQGPASLRRNVLAVGLDEVEVTHHEDTGEGSRGTLPVSSNVPSRSNMTAFTGATGDMKAALTLGYLLRRGSQFSVRTKSRA